MELAGRIMELSEKNRELTADLESEWTKVWELMKKAKDLEKEVSVCKSLIIFKLHSVVYVGENEIQVKMIFTYM